MMRPLLFALLLLSGTAPALADAEDRAAFVEANLVWVFYHEVAHALIDQLSLPVLGREEDAADALAAVLIDEIWEPDSAVQLAWYQALGWMVSAEEALAQDAAYWDVHGHDMQRFYNLVCLWYGAEPETRADFAETFELPADRADGCADEHALAHRGWFAHLSALAEDAPGEGLVFWDDTGDFAEEIVKEEVRTLNDLFALPFEVTVSIDSCDDVNAFYFPADQHILICREYADYLWQRAEDLDL